MVVVKEQQVARAPVGLVRGGVRDAGSVEEQEHVSKCSFVVASLVANALSSVNLAIGKYVNLWAQVRKPR